MHVKETYVFQKLFQTVLLVALDENSLVINVLDDEVVAMICIDLDEYCFDRRVALNQYASISSVEVSNQEPEERL